MSRYEARVDGDRVILIDRVGDQSKVVTLPAEFGEALIEHAQAFLDAGLARFGSMEAFERACLWMLDFERLAQSV